jgi:GTP-binding protein Era
MPTNNTMPHKSGFVNILGNPNVGKSTLMNALTGIKLSIITSKVQTTRHRIMGIVNGEDFQIIYSDTPGIIRPVYKMQEVMVKSAYSALSDADIILFVTDIYESVDPSQDIIKRLGKTKIPVLLLINKIDLGNQGSVDQRITAWSDILPDAEIIPVSALKKFNLEKIFDRIITLLPESPPYYPKDELTDKSERFFVSEIIREKILMNYRKEVPYSVEVEVISFKESERLISTSVNIYVMRDSQKGIIIGRQGLALKKTGTMARKELEDFFGKKVFLEIQVKVKKDWRNNPRMLRQFGYI